MKKLMMALLLGMSSVVFADTWTDPDTLIKWSYEVYGGEVYLGTSRDPLAIMKYTSGAVKIPSFIAKRPVRHIHDHAFENCFAITSVIIPSTVMSISRHAFSGCSKLERVTISEGVASIEEEAFSKCGALKSVVIPKSTKSIGVKAFANCFLLRDVKLSRNTFVAKDALVGCSKALTVSYHEVNPAVVFWMVVAVLVTSAVVLKRWLVKRDLRRRMEAKGVSVEDFQRCDDSVAEGEHEIKETKESCVSDEELLTECPYCHSHVGEYWENCMTCGLDLYKYKYILKTEDERYVYVQTNRDRFARKAEETKRKAAEDAFEKKCLEDAIRERAAQEERQRKEEERLKEEKSKARRDHDAKFNDAIDKCAIGLGVSTFQLFDFLRDKYGMKEVGSPDTELSNQDSRFWAGFWAFLIVVLICIGINTAVMSQDEMHVELFGCAVLSAKGLKTMLWVHGIEAVVWLIVLLGMSYDAITTTRSPWIGFRTMFGGMIVGCVVPLIVMWALSRLLFH